MERTIAKLKKDNQRMELQMRVEHACRELAESELYTARLVVEGGIEDVDIEGLVATVSRKKKEVEECCEKWREFRDAEKEK